jgi:hypothetical protein
VRLAVDIGPDRRPIAMPIFDGTIEKFSRAVETRRIRDVRVVEQEHRPLILRRQVIARESIDVS